MSTDEIQAIKLTVETALLSTLISLPIAIFFGWLLARKNFFFKPILEVFLTLPLVAPPVVTGYLLLLALGRNGVVGKFLNDSLGIKLAFNFAALVIASCVVSLPLGVRSIRSAFEMVDPLFEKASFTLGVNRFATFFRVTLPLALPGIISGAVLIFARSIGEFGATITLAGSIPGKTQTMSILIYSNMSVPGKEGEAARLTVISLVIAFLAILVSEIFQRKNRYFKS